MNRCKIILPSSGTVDMYQDDAISLTYQVSDIRNPQKRNGDYSKTIKIPGTHNNNRLFHEIFELGIDRYFNPNKKSRCTLMVDTNPIMTGYMRLREIIKKDKGVEYNIEITGRISDFFLALGDTKVKDLIWSDLDHTFSRANLISSWIATPGTGYLYPYIDYGYSQNDYTYKVDDFLPTVYVKEVWDRIFESVGYQYSSTSNFFNSSYFNRLVMPCNSDRVRLTDAQLQARKFRASRVTTAQTLTMGGSQYTYHDLVMNNDTTSPNQDTSNAYNTTTGVWTCPASGYYKIGATLQMQPSGTGSPNSNLWCRIIDVTNTPRQIDMVSMNYVNLSSTIQYLISLGSPIPIYISSGTQIKLQAATYDLGNPSATIKLNPGSFFQAEALAEIKEGDTMVMANTIDPELKCRDFVNWIMKMHNLFFEYDKDTDRKIVIDPRNDYYNNTVQDWTQKRDLSRDLEIEPMGALQAKNYEFTYKEDKDVLNEKYQKEIGETYGRYKRVVDNDFLVNTQKEEIGFAPTPLDSTYAFNPSSTWTANLPRYFPRLCSLDNNGIRVPKKVAPRILYYGGLKQARPWELFSTVLQASSGVTQYPYIGHLDDPITPTLDTNFGVPKVVYYDLEFNSTYTNNNLYNKYWKQELDEITHYNSSIVTGYFKLSPNDIASLDFRHIYRFDFQNFRLNKVVDYNPLSDGFTKCEFIKMIKGTAFVPASTTGTLGGSDVVMDDDDGPAPAIRSQVGSNANSSGGFVGQNIITGSYNVVGTGSAGVMVSGLSNNIGPNSQNISLINSSGVVVLGGLSNVTVINSSGVTVTTPNTMIVNNQVLFAPGSSNYTQWITSGSTMYSGNDGNIGMGTSDPYGKAHIHKPSSDPQLWLTRSDNSQGNEVTARLGTNNTTYKNYSAYIKAIQQGGIDRWSLSFGVSSGSIAYEQFGITQYGNLYGRTIHNNPQETPSGLPRQYIASGTYTPSLTNVSNTTSLSPSIAQWLRVGNVVHVSGYLSVNASASANCTFTASLPLTSSLGNDYELSGSATSKNASAALASVRINGYPSTDTALFEFTGNAAASPYTMTYTFTYLIL